MEGVPPFHTYTCYCIYLDAGQAIYTDLPNRIYTQGNHRTAQWCNTWQRGNVDELRTPKDGMRI